jgi:hypothetical protein
MVSFEQYIRDYLKVDRPLTAADYEEAFLRMTRSERDAAADVFESDPTQVSFAEAVGGRTPFEI